MDKNRFRAGIAGTTKVLSCYPAHEAISLLSELGYTAVSIEAGYLDAQLENNITSLPEIKAALEDSGIEAVIHAPTKNRDFVRYNICSKDEDFREESILQFKDALELAHQMGADVVTMHPGYVDSRDEPADEEYWELQISALGYLAMTAEGYGVRIGIELMENRPGEFVTEPDDAKLLLETVGSDNVGVTLDLTHSYTFGPEKPLEHIEQLREDIVHVHVSGYSDEKTHVPFSMSSMPAGELDDTLDRLLETYDGVIVVEGHIRGLMDETPENQRMIVESNMAYIRKNLKSLLL